MKDIGTRLRAADPLLHDPGMSPEEIDAMRRAVVAAARSEKATSWFPPLLALVATVAALVIAIVGAHVRATPRDTSRAARGLSDAAQSPESPSPAADGNDGKRQLQFATPGGTRVIWVFDPEFNP
jgi:hypothetical protein